MRASFRWVGKPVVTYYGRWAVESTKIIRRWIFSDQDDGRKEG